MTTFDEFAGRTRGLLEGKAANKGYAADGADGPNPLYEFIRDHLGASPHAHALGEIVYKAVRFAHTHNPEDVQKIASWAFLILKHTPEP